MSDICHAKRIADKEREDKRIAEMEDESKPLFYTLEIIGTLFACMLINDYIGTKKDAQQVSDLLSKCANGQNIEIDRAHIECKRTELVAGLK